MIRFTHIFLARFIETILPTLSSSTESAGITCPLTLVSGGITSSVGSYSICEGKHLLPSSMGISSITTGTSVMTTSTLNTPYALDCLKTTEAYFESMDEDQLLQLIGKLEEKDKNLSDENFVFQLKK